MPWHITPLENLPRILREGLVPAIGPRSEDLGEEIAAVHLFSRFDDLMDANWVEDAFDEEETLALLHVAVPSSKGAWTEMTTAVPPERIMLISRDLDEVADSPALQALDRVADPLADLASFRATRTRMPAADYGKLAGDPQWKGDDREFLVYAASSYIVARDDGRHELCIESDGWLEGHDGETLESLERRLFDWAQADREPILAGTDPSHDLQDRLARAGWREGEDPEGAVPGRHLVHDDLGRLWPLDDPMGALADVGAIEEDEPRP